MSSVFISDVNMAAGYDYAESDAARMLAAALRRRQVEDGVSLRDLAKLLNYKQATVLSHMANGRIRVPLKRAAEIASVAGLSAPEFMTAVVDQHQYMAVPEPAMRVAHLRPIKEPGFASELELIAGQRLSSLSDEHKRIMREVVAEVRPARRWLSISELPTVETIREVRPRSRDAGLSYAEREAIRAALSDNRT